MWDCFVPRNDAPIKVLANNTGAYVISSLTQHYDPIKGHGRLLRFKVPAGIYIEIRFPESSSSLRLELLFKMVQS